MKRIQIRFILLISEKKFEAKRAHPSMEWKVKTLYQGWALAREQKTCRGCWRGTSTPPSPHDDIKFFWLQGLFKKYFCTRTPSETCNVCSWRSNLLKCEEKSKKNYPPPLKSPPPKKGPKNQNFFQNRYFSHIKIFKKYVQGFFSHSITLNDNLRKKIRFLAQF